jgi:hypothetical protein
MKFEDNYTREIWITKRFKHLRCDHGKQYNHTKQGNHGNQSRLCSKKKLYKSQISNLMKIRPAVVVLLHVDR